MVAYKFKWWHLIVAIIIIVLLYQSTRQGQWVWITGDEPSCWTYSLAETNAKERESASDDTCLIISLNPEKGGAHSCSDPNNAGFDPNKLSSVICKTYWTSDGNWDLTKDGVPVTMDNNCNIDSDCSKFVGVKATSYYWGDSGSFPSQLTCFDGHCKSYYQGQPLCVDTDNGKNYYVKGKAIAKWTSTDYCVNSNRLQEAYCDGTDEPQLFAFNCFEVDKVCRDGACVDIQQCNTNADTNCDGIVSRDELGEYIVDWVNGQITRTELGNAIQAWSG